MRPLSHADVLALVDEEMRPALVGTLAEHLPAGPLDVATVRAIDARLATERGAPSQQAAPPVVRHLRTTGGGVVVVRVHGVATSPSAVLWIHGGGLYLGTAQADDAFCAGLAADLAACVVAVDYRLAPEHPHPAALDDCLAAYAWTAARHDRVVVAGASAGGGLAAAVCLAVRDEDVRQPSAMHLYYPMLDDRRTRSAVRFADGSVWNGALAELAWASYLGSRTAGPLAAPARARRLAGLPSAYLDVGLLDMFLDETTRFAARLDAAGVTTELRTYAGAVHAFDVVAPEAAVSHTARQGRLAHLRRALAGRGCDG